MRLGLLFLACLAACAEEETEPPATFSTTVTGATEPGVDPLPWAALGELVGITYLVATLEDPGPSSGAGSAWFWEEDIGVGSRQYYDWCGRVTSSPTLRQVDAVVLQHDGEAHPGIDEGGGWYSFNDVWSAEELPTTSFEVSVVRMLGIGDVTLDMGPLPPSPVVTTPTDSVDPKAPLTVEWQPMGTEAITLVGSNHNGLWITCYAEDDGAFDIPANVIDQLVGNDPGAAALDWLNLRIDSTSRIDHPVGDGQLYGTATQVSWSTRLSVVR